MQFIVNLSIAVDEAESPEQALEIAKTGRGKTISFTANPRPAQPARPNSLIGAGALPFQQKMGIPSRPPA